MPTTRRRRIVRRAVMALAVVVLLASGYVGLWLTCCFAYGAQLTPSWADTPMRVVFAPIALYTSSRYPGSSGVSEIASWTMQCGDRWSRGE